MHTFYARRQHVMDVMVGRRIFNACWFSASLGISVLQMRLLAQAWQLSHLALASACLMSLWTLGTLVGLRLPNSPRMWGFTLLASALLWWGGPSVVSWHLPPSSIPGGVWVNSLALGLVAAFLGASSSAWLTQQRDWPSAGEHTTLVRNLLGLTVGLVVVWLLPMWAGLLGLACCVPLLTLDACSSGRAPLPNQGGIAAAWMRRYWRVEQRPLQLEQRALPRGWWREWLAERSQSSRGYLSLSLLASSVAVVLGSVWGAVPTPFAAGLATTHSLEKLGWLLGGQFVVVLLGACLLLFVARGVIGFPDRLVPPSWQVRARFLAGVATPGMAAGLVALGLPSLQAPWWLAVSLAVYTLSSAVWGLLLPRVRPAFATQAQAERHLWLGQGKALPTALQLAHASACEMQVNRLLAPIEGVLVAVLTPLLGWLIDMRGSVDPVLVSVGVSFLTVLMVGGVIAALVPMVRHTKSPHQATTSASRYIAHPVLYRRTRPAW